MHSVGRRTFELVEPIGVIPYAADEPNAAMFALGFTNDWDTSFAARAAPLGLAPAEVVDALFSNFAPGEVARHIPKVWRTTTPEAAIAARQAGCVKALRHILGDLVDAPAFARAADLLLEAATSAPFEGRPVYAALLGLPRPDDVVARPFHAASLLREHRGDGHIAALMIEGVGRLEAHVLLALDMDMPAEKFGRIRHLPAAQIAAVIDGMRARGLIGEDGWLSAAGRAVKRRVEAHRRPGSEAVRFVHECKEQLGPPHPTPARPRPHPRRRRTPRTSSPSQALNNHLSRRARGAGCYVMDACSHGDMAPRRLLHLRWPTSGRHPRRRR